MIMQSTGKIRSYRYPAWLRNLQSDWMLLVILVGSLAISFVPLALMFNISFKDMGQYFAQPMGLTIPLHLENYEVAFNVLWQPFINSVIVSGLTIIGTLVVSSLGAYAFARFRFPGRDHLYWLIIGVLFIPGILTLTTRFILVANYGMLNTYAVLIIPGIANHLVFTVFVLRAFFAGLPEEILEAARVDGANALQVLWQIVVPLSRPILATLGIIILLSVWGDWIWPLITIKNAEMRPMALQVLFMSADVGPHYGLQMAGFSLATIPLIIMFALFSRQFIEGLSSGALKW